MLVDYLDRGRLVNPDGLCVIRGDGTHAYSYREFFDLTHRIAEGLKGAGHGPGSEVAVFAPNSPLGFAAVVGVIRSGAAWVALNPMAEQSELTQLLELLGCDYMIYAEAFAERAVQMVQETSSIGGAVSFGLDEPGDEFEAWLGPVGQESARLPYAPDEPVMYLGTGGTTGAPKGIVITNRQLTTMALAFNAHLPEPTPPVYLMATPMTHAAGSVAFPVLGLGGTVVIHQGVKADLIFDSVERHRVSRMFLPPTALYTLLAAPDVRQRDFSSMRSLVYAAAPISVEKLVEAIEVFGPVLAQTYGQSEAPMIATFFGPDEHAEALADPEKRARLASCGRPSLVASVEIMGDDGDLLAAGERGEIVIRGDLVMKGYYGNPEASADVLREGGWLATGDIGYRDDDGYVFIVDRARDMIISGGFNVFPSEVERVIWTLDAVLDCAVIGVPDEKWGEAVTAVVELKPGQELCEQDVIALCKQSLGSIRAPKAVHFRALPRSAAGKVLKRTLRDEFWAGHERRV